MIEQHKIDSKLGCEINDHLIKHGIETPTTHPLTQSVSNIHTIENAFKTIMETLGLDLSDDSLVDTPIRVARMFVNELYWGLSYDNFPKCTAIENKMGYNEMIMERDITCMSACEHHFVTIDAVAHVAYIPKNHVLGLSKINRIVEFFARRPQIQERLTQQIAYTLKYILQTDDVAVVIDGVHYCVKSRGVRDNTSKTTTSYLSGGFRNDHALRSEFMGMIR